ncbi:cGMP-specific 3',5'-cyclic phosphodiesterase-like isoform X1 [Ischnura elegans]|uniref:cGMP-specific 3',5'-cyclic phosphodiesterase-like isoform X1 n=1 Tax=Ischnura elegans TaxID=197161 RepID=UPI001ED88632|nr:cGMP-specific 3',5'-cyclic phosphodiesterase-like isoform X1 [Ischnura elegans]
MIPYATCLCFGRRGASWRPEHGDDKRRSGGRVSIEREQSVILIRVTGPEEGYLEPVRGSSERTSSSLSLSVGGGCAPPSPLSDGDRLLLETLDLRESRPLHTGRFLTMNHKRRRRRLTTRTLVGDAALLDDIHNKQAQIVLDRVGEWPFNAFTLDTETGGRSVPILCVHLFHWYGLLDYFGLDVASVWKLFTLVEEGYHSTNPYHNAIHAADVTQAMHCFLQEEKIREHLTPLEIMAALIGAVTHDLDHPGVNQPFLIATSNHLAALYENTSVLENHHWRSAVGCLIESGVAAQLGFRREELEHNISSLILATDITRQQEFLTRFKRYLDGDLLDMKRATDRHFILQIALKCADISNPCRPWEVSKKWSHKVCEEFFRQGDYERKLNLPVTSLCDRHTTSVPKIQTGFFRFVVAPLFDEWHRFLQTSLSTEMINYLNSNRARWDSLVQQEQAEETRTEVSDAELPEVDDVASTTEDGSPDNDTVPSPLPSLLVDGGGWCRRAGRRHSVPLSAPREPTALTIIRRESLPGSAPRRLPSDAIVHVEGGESSLSLCSVCSRGGGGGEEQRPVSADTLLPEPSITSMTSSREASRISGVLHGGGGTKYLTRQQTFPPLQPVGYPFSRLRYMSTTIDMSTHDERTNEEARSSTDTSSRTSAVSSPDCEEGCGRGSWLLGKEGKREPPDDGGRGLRERSKVARLDGDSEDSPRHHLLAGKENRDPGQALVADEADQARGSTYRKSTPQGLARLQCRRGSAPVALLRLDEGATMPPQLPPALVETAVVGTVLSAMVVSHPEKSCRRGSMPAEVPRQSVLRSLGSKENTLSCMARRASLPYDLIRHSSSSLLECLNFQSGNVIIQEV